MDKRSNPLKDEIDDSDSDISLNNLVLDKDKTAQDSLPEEMFI